MDLSVATRDNAKGYRARRLLVRLNWRDAGKEMLLLKLIYFEIVCGLISFQVAELRSARTSYYVRLHVLE